MSGEGRPSFRSVRKTAYVARSLHTRLYARPYVKDDPEPRSIFKADDQRAFRRAYVEASQRACMYVQRDEEGVRLVFLGQEVARVGAGGALVISADLRNSPISLSPKSIGEWAVQAFGAFKTSVAERYAVHVGVQSAAEVMFGISTDGGEEVRVRLQGVEGEHPIGLKIYSLMGGYMPSRLDVLRRMIQGVLSSFSRELDAAAVRALWRAQLAGHTPLVNATLRGDTASQWWVQALDAYPALMSLVLRTDREITSETFHQRSLTGFERLAPVIESGTSLVSVLAKDVGMDEGRVRRLRGVGPQRTRSIWVLKDAMPVLRHLPYHLWPARRADYLTVSSLAGALARTRLTWDKEALNTLLGGTKVPLAAERRLAALEHLHDVVEDLRRVVHSKVVAGGKAYDAIVGSVTELSLGRLVDLIHAWHRAQRQAGEVAAQRVAQARSELDRLSWTGLLPQKQMHLGEVLVTELTTPVDLLTEGRELGHCVGSYYPDCLAGESRVVSLSSASGSSRSTIEFHLTRRKSQMSLRVRQHYSYGNEAPSSEHAKACRALIKELGRTGNLAWPQNDSHDAAGLYDHLDFIYRKTVAEHTLPVFLAALPALRSAMEGKE